MVPRIILGWLWFVLPFFFVGPRAERRDRHICPDSDQIRFVVLVPYVSLGSD